MRKAKATIGGRDIHPGLVLWSSNTRWSPAAGIPVEYGVCGIPVEYGVSAYRADNCSSGALAGPGPSTSVPSGERP